MTLFMKSLDGYTCLFLLIIVIIIITINIIALLVMYIFSPHEYILHSFASCVGVKPIGLKPLEVAIPFGPDSQHLHRSPIGLKHLYSRCTYRLCLFCIWESMRKLLSL